MVLVVVETQRGGELIVGGFGREAVCIYLAVVHQLAYVDVGHQRVDGRAYAYVVAGVGVALVVYVRHVYGDVGEVGRIAESAVDVHGLVRDDARVCELVDEGHVKDGAAYSEVVGVELPVCEVFAWERVYVLRQYVLEALGYGAERKPPLQ